jgi:excinuclease UvrABC nuclease subunit
MIIICEWYRLDDQEALRQVPKKAGVYELADADRVVIYIGRAKGGNLRNRLRTHARERVNECIRMSAVCFRYAVTKAHRRDEKELFVEYKTAHDGKIPQCNTIDPSLRR